MSLPTQDLSKRGQSVLKAALGRRAVTKENIGKLSRHDLIIQAGCGTLTANEIIKWARLCGIEIARW